MSLTRFFPPVWVAVVSVIAALGTAVVFEHTRAETWKARASASVAACNADKLAEARAADQAAHDAVAAHQLRRIAELEAETRRSSAAADIFRLAAEEAEAGADAAYMALREVHDETGCLDAGLPDDVVIGLYGHD